jgi:hypothetical protein
MDVKVLDAILAADERVRFVSVLGSDLKTVASKAREGLSLEEGRKYGDGLLVNLAAPVVLGTLSKFTDKCGNLICAGIRYDDVTFIFFKLCETYVVVCTEAGPPYIIMQRIEEKLQI